MIWSLFYSRKKNIPVSSERATGDASLQAEFDKRFCSINDIRFNLAILQADDGKLRPAVVTSDSVSAGLKEYVIDKATKGAATDAAIAVAASQSAQAGNTAASASEMNASAGKTAAATSANAAENSAMAAACGKTVAALSETDAAASKTLAAEILSLARTFCGNLAAINTSVSTATRGKTAGEVAAEFALASKNTATINEIPAVTAETHAIASACAALAQARSITLEDLVNRVIAKHTAFSALSGTIIGQRQALEDQLNTGTSVAEVQAINVDFVLPA